MRRVKRRDAKGKVFEVLQAEPAEHALLALYALQFRKCPICRRGLPKQPDKIDEHLLSHYEVAA